MNYTIDKKETHIEVILNLPLTHKDIEQLLGELENYSAFIISINFKDKKITSDLLLEILDNFVNFTKNKNKIMVVLKPEKIDEKILEQKNIEWAPTLSEATDLIFMLILEKELK